MAVPNEGQRVAQAFDAYMDGKPEDTIHDDYGQLRRMEKNKKSFTGGGDNVRGAFEYKLNSTVAWIADTDVVDTTRIDIFDEWELPWRQIGATAVMSTFEEAINRGESKKLDLLAGKLENLRMSVREKKNAALFTAQAGLAPVGLPDIVSATPTSGTFAGVNRAVHAFWRNQQTLGTKTTSAYDNLRSAMRTIYTACSNGYSTEHPEFFVFTSTDFNGYESLLVANERFADKSAGDGGFKNEVLKFKGALVSYDGDCPSGTGYALNTNHIKLGYLNGYWMKGYPAVDPANQFTEVFKIETKANLFSLRPRHLGVITSIT
jgi:hypothetical protein